MFNSRPAEVSRTLEVYVVLIYSALLAHCLAFSSVDDKRLAYQGRALIPAD